MDNLTPQDPVSPHDTGLLPPEADIGPTKSPVELRIFLSKKLLHHLASAIRLNAQTTKMYRKEIVDLERLMTWDTR